MFSNIEPWNNDLTPNTSIISSRSHEFQDVFLTKALNSNSLEEKFSNLERNVRILMETTPPNLSEKPLKIQNHQNSQDLDALILVLKGIKRECEVIRESQEESSVDFLKDYANKLVRLETEVKKFEEQKSVKSLKNTNFLIYHNENVNGKVKEEIIEEKFIEDYRLRALEIKSSEINKLKKSKKSIEIKEGKENSVKTSAQKKEKKVCLKKNNSLCNNKIL